MPGIFDSIYDIAIDTPYTPIEDIIGVIISPQQFGSMAIILYKNITRSTCTR